MTDLITVNYAQNGASIKADSMGMREMQARAYEKRNAQYLLLKAPPASGKSRALMFLALDKVRHQGLKKAIVAVPEMSIGGSFNDTVLSQYGFFADWHVEPEYNLCTPGNAGKVDRVIGFLTDPAPEFLVCTHATFRFACQRLFEQNQLDLLDKVLVAVDEFHHVSAEEGNELGKWIDLLMEQTSAHIVAMTGSYFRGDAMPILSQKAESQFETVAYTYYEQLNGYKYLKSLGIGYHFYHGRYLDALAEVLDPTKKTIIHIPHVMSVESTGNKLSEVDAIIDVLGTLVSADENHIFNVRLKGSQKIIRVADLVTDDRNRETVLSYLRSINQEPNLEKQKAMVDIIIALGMAKEGFDWPWCEHVLTIGYRNSLTEVVQIIGRATRDCVGKPHAQFTNLIAQPDANDEDVRTAVNNMLKAITLSLLMEQVLAPPIHFVPRSLAELQAGKEEGTTIIIDDSKAPIPPKVAKLLQEGAVDQIIEKMLTSQPETVNRPIVQPEQAKLFTYEDLPKIVLTTHPELNQEESQYLSRLVVAQMAAKSNTPIPNLFTPMQPKPDSQGNDGVSLTGTGDETLKVSNQFVKGTDRFINVQQLNLDLIDQFNPFQDAYEILSKAVTPTMLKTIQDIVVTKRSDVTEMEALALYPEVKAFKSKYGKWPSVSANDDYEVRLGEVLAFIRQALAKKQQGA